MKQKSYLCSVPLFEIKQYIYLNVMANCGFYNWQLTPIMFLFMENWKLSFLASRDNWNYMEEFKIEGNPMKFICK